MAEARRVAEELDLPSWWLGVCISGKDDPGKRRVFDRPGLRVMAASSEHIFAARTRDIDDLRHWAELVGVTAYEQAPEPCARFCPGEKISPRADAVPAGILHRA